MTRGKLVGEGAANPFAAGNDDASCEIPGEPPRAVAGESSGESSSAAPANAPGSASGNGVVPASFEIAMAELESLVERMEGGRLPLEESLAAYQRGVVLVKFCRDTLGQVSQRVRILEADLLQPFEAVADDRDA